MRVWYSFGTTSSLCHIFSIVDVKLLKSFHKDLVLKIIYMIITYHSGQIIKHIRNLSSKLNMYVALLDDAVNQLFFPSLIFACSHINSFLQLIKVSERISLSTYKSVLSRVRQMNLRWRSFPSVNVNCVTDSPWLVQPYGCQKIETSVVPSIFQIELLWRAGGCGLWREGTYYYIWYWKRKRVSIHWLWPWRSDER